MLDCFRTGHAMYSTDVLQQASGFFLSSKIKNELHPDNIIRVIVVIVYCTLQCSVSMQPTCEQD